METIKGLIPRAFLLLAIVASGLAPRSVDAASITSPEFSDAYFEAPNSGGPYGAPITGINLVIRQFAASTSDVAVAKFDLSALPSNVTITGVQLSYTNSVVTGNTGRVVDVLGFAKTGAVASGDATTSATILGSYDNFAQGLGPQTISLNAATFQSVLGSSRTLGLRFQGDVESVNTAIASGSEQLVITFATPEPASLIQAALAIGSVTVLLGLPRLRRATGLGRS